MNPPRSLASFRSILAAAMPLAALLGFATDASATNYTVNSLGDTQPTLGGAGSGTFGDLRYCITQANYGASGSTHSIGFSVAGKITLGAHELVINSNLTLVGPGASLLTVDGNLASRVIFVVSNHTVSISGLTLTRGTGKGNDATGFDPGGNGYDGYGGAILNDGSTVTVSDSTISNCLSTSIAYSLSGGGIFNRARSANATLTVNNCVITANDTGNYGDGGGGIYNYAFGGTATLNLSNSLVTNNKTGGDGGGILCYGLSSVVNTTITNCTISGNTAAGYSGGGGIFNTCVEGSSLANMTITGSTISGNAVTGYSSGGGGGILNGRSTYTPCYLTMTNCTVSGNASNKVGGGIANGSSIAPGNNEIRLTLMNCAINSNTAGTTGGGISNSDDNGVVKVNNCSISGNAAQTRGGGFYNNGPSRSSNARAVFTNSTICGNSALSGGAGIANDLTQSGSGTGAATVTLMNTILALNPTGANFNTAYGTGVSGGFNLSDDATCQAFLTGQGDKNSTASGLQVDGLGKPLLQNNGGPTKTVALLAGSAAIDAGKAANDPVTSLPATTDQRGFARPIDTPGVVNAAGGDGSDIGAFEFGSGPSINVSALPVGYGTVSGGGPYAFNSSATVTATPNVGYVFANWTEGANVVSTTPSYNFTVTATRTLVANFRTPIPATISLAQSVGTPTTLTSGATVDCGSALVGNNTIKNFTIHNNGDLNLTLGALTIDGVNAGDFSISTSPTSPVAGQGTTAFNVTFTPGAVGTRTAALHIPSNDAGASPFNLNLTASGYTTPQARITSPVGGSTLTAALTTFTWDTGVGVTSYALWVGSTAGGFELYAGNEGTNHSKTLTLPDDGRTLYVTLYSLISGVYQSNTYTYTAYRAPTPVKAQLTSPQNGSALTSASLPLVWNAGVGVTSYYLCVGTSPGGYDLYAGDQGTALSRTISNLPVDRRVYVTLYSLIKGAYQANQYFFNPLPSVRAAVNSPANGSTLVGNQLNLFWTQGTGVSKYIVWIGSAYGGYDLGAADAGTAASRSFTVPQDGGPFYVTLYSLINGGYQAENYWFTTALPVSGNRAAVLTSPANASTLPSATMNLTWDAGVGAASYALWVGSTPNGYDLYSGLEGSSLSKSVAIPGDGRRIYVTLHTLISGIYQSNSYWFTAPTLPDGGAAQVTSPASGSTLTDANLPLTWGAAAGATQYYLFVGNSPGASDLYAGSQGTTLSKTVSGMPLDGRPIHVTLYSLINNAWKTSSAWFTAANTATGNRRALITSPANGTTLPGSATTFNWGGGVGMTSYALWIGSSPGAYDLWSSAENVATTSRQVTLPTDGRKLYVTLYSFIGGAWQGASYIYTASNVAVTKAVITSPTAGSSLTGASQTFAWSASNTATAYALWIGRAPGGYDIYAGAEGLSTSKTLTTLPTDGSPVYVTIYSLIKGAWQSSESIFTAALP